MSKAPASETDHPDAAPDGQAAAQADAQVDAMKDRLRKDVASWSAARSGAAVRDLGEAGVPVVPAARQPAPQRARRTRRATPKPPPSEAQHAAPKQPFRMSYDGITQADYITYMITRGTR
jgi:hypothetical protein